MSGNGTFSPSEALSMKEAKMDSGVKIFNDYISEICKEE